MADDDTASSKGSSPLHVLFGNRDNSSSSLIRQKTSNMLVISHSPLLTSTNSHYDLLNDLASLKGRVERLETTEQDRDQVIARMIKLLYRLKTRMHVVERSLGEGLGRMSKIVSLAVFVRQVSHSRYGGKMYGPFDVFGKVFSDTSWSIVNHAIMLAIAQGFLSIVHADSFIGTVVFLGSRPIGLRQRNIARVTMIIRLCLALLVVLSVKKKISYLGSLIARFMPAANRKGIE